MNTVGYKIIQIFSHSFSKRYKKHIIIITEDTIFCVLTLKSSFYGLITLGLSGHICASTPKVPVLHRRHQDGGLGLSKDSEKAFILPIKKYLLDKYMGLVTLENPVVSGELARHAYEEKPKTDNPMTLAEAKSFVMDIAKRWLASLRH